MANDGKDSLVRVQDVAKMLDSTKLTLGYQDDWSEGFNTALDRGIEELATLETVGAIDETASSFPKFVTYSFRFDGLDWVFESPYGNTKGKTLSDAIESFKKLIKTSN